MGDNSKTAGVTLPERLQGNLSQRLVIKFAVAGTTNRCDGNDALGGFVCGVVLLDEGNEIGFDNCLAGQWFNESSDGLSKAFVRNADYCGIGDCRVQFERLFNFFRIDLFAAGVDALAATTQELDGAVGINAGPITRDRPTNSIDDLEGLRRLLGVFLVTTGRVALQGNTPDFITTRLNFAAIFGEDFGVGSQLKRSSF